MNDGEDGGDDEGGDDEGGDDEGGDDEGGYDEGGDDVRVVMMMLVMTSINANFGCFVIISPLNPFVLLIVHSPL